MKRNAHVSNTRYQMWWIDHMQDGMSDKEVITRKQKKLLQRETRNKLKKYVKSEVSNYERCKY